MSHTVKRNVPSHLGGVTSSRPWRAVVVIVATALLASSCTGREAERPGSSTGDLLNIGQTAPPNSLDPARINQAFEWYINLAYDPLIYRTPDGLKPRLAESWRYVGAGNKTFELKLRANVTFSDGSPLTSDVVKSNIEYFRTAGGQAVPHLTPIKSIDTPDPLTVRLNLSAPHPELPLVFTQDYLAGNLISGPALKQPAKLATQTFGAGPYVLDPAETVPKDHYTYTQNPKYWDAQNIHYKKIVIKVIPNPNTALAALKTGQVDIIQGTHATAEAAKSAQLQVKATPQVFQGLALADRDGKILPALGDVRVRQAINLAINRERITKGLFGEYGTVTEQIVLPGQDGYNDKTYYPHNPEKAKQLLAAAGYPDGFTLPAVTTSFSNQNLIAQAIADDLKKVGVLLDLTNEADPSNYIKQLSSAKFPAYVIGHGNNRVFMMGTSLFLPTAPVFNPMKSSDPQIEQWYKQAAAADDATRAELDKQIIARLAEQAWFAPVTFTPVFFFARSTVTGIESTTDAPIASPVAWRPA
jgi:peptide/nickel transport system substrate-binding protein